MSRKKVQTTAEKPKALKETLIKVSPLTENQHKAFESFESGKHLLLHGVAGTGKSFVALYLAMREFLSGRYRQVIIFRSVVQSRDMGFLPGTPEEKYSVFEEPYISIFAELYNRSDAYDILKGKDILKFSTTSFLRGMTYRNSIIIADEIQNMWLNELTTIMTRIGDNCKVILCGDMYQTDLERGRSSGFIDFLRIVEIMEEFSMIKFGIEDIVRSDLVKSFIIARNKLNI